MKSEICNASFPTALLSPRGAGYVKGRTGPGTGKRSNVESVGLHLWTRNVPDIDSMNRGRDDGKWIEKETERGCCPMDEVQLENKIDFRLGSMTADKR